MWDLGREVETAAPSKNFHVVVALICGVCVICRICIFIYSVPPPGPGLDGHTPVMPFCFILCLVVLCDSLRSTYVAPFSFIMCLAVLCGSVRLTYPCNALLFCDVPGMIMFCDSLRYYCCRCCRFFYM